MKEKKEKASMTVKEFFALFPTDESCLVHLFDVRFGQGYKCPKCERKAKWYRIKAERAYSCQWCGHHIHPTVNTPFEDSRTSLQSWFYAIYLFTTSRHGVSGKELERQLGVTYKTAWRMGHQIRQYMAECDGEEMLSGEVECDETYVGGAREGTRGRGAAGKTIDNLTTACFLSIRASEKGFGTSEAGAKKFLDAFLDKFEELAS